MRIKGTVRPDRRTKDLAKRLKPGEIALIDHEDIDSTAAAMLVESRVGAVINAAKSCSGRYPNLGPVVLLRENIPILDNVGQAVFDVLREGEHIEVRDGSVWRQGQIIAEGDELTLERAQVLRDQARESLGAELELFAANTLSYVTTEKSLLLDPTNLPEVKTVINGRHALVVVRGEGYKEDLAIVRAYIRDMKPVLIGVDGGADALIEMGFKPHIIIGDMDSVSDSALRCGAEVIVHAYADGRAPGQPRCDKLGIPTQICAVPGTSEDLALLLAYEKGAELIVAVGTHSHLVDFLDKGRKGMSSTFLVRLKVGNRLVDAKGVSKLYRVQPAGRHIALLGLAALLVVLTVLAFSPTLQDRMQLVMDDMQSQVWHFWVKLRMWER